MQSMNTRYHRDVDELDDIDDVMEFIEEIIIEYYGHTTWALLKQYIINKRADISDFDELINSIREFFGGSEEVVGIILSSLPRYSRRNPDL